jgi:2-oxoglutarate/2-oxoacid ferredoxin oxidoreductase subunit beta
VNAIKNKGLSFIDFIAQCPTYFGRKNKLPQPMDMLKWMKERSVQLSDAKNMSPSDLAGKFVLGEFVNAPAPEYTAEYDRVAKMLREKGKQ